MYLPVVSYAKEGAETKAEDLTEMSGETAARLNTDLASSTSAVTSCFVIMPHPLYKITVDLKYSSQTNLKTSQNLELI